MLVPSQAVDGGYVQVFGNERGATWINQFDPETQNIGGGFSYIRFASNTSVPANVPNVLCTAYIFGPHSNDSTFTYKRSFGIGYYRNSLRIKDTVFNERLSRSR